jgi:hypothetical protein
MVSFAHAGQRTNTQQATTTVIAIGQQLDAVTRAARLLTPEKRDLYLRRVAAARFVVVVGLDLKTVRNSVGPSRASMATNPTAMPTTMSPGMASHSLTIWNPPVRKSDNTRSPLLKSGH